MTRALLPKRVFTSREEGASPVSGRGREPVSGKLGVFSWAFTRARGIWIKRTSLSGAICFDALH